jgi:hypothetical protein
MRRASQALFARSEQMRRRFFIASLGQTHCKIGPVRAMKAMNSPRSQALSL